MMSEECLQITLAAAYVCLNNMSSIATTESATDHDDQVSQSPVRDNQHVEKKSGVATVTYGSCQHQMPATHEAIQGRCIIPT